MKTVKILIYLLVLSALIIAGCSIEPDKNKEQTKDVTSKDQSNNSKAQLENQGNLKITEIESKYKISVEEIIEAYHIRELHYFRNPLAYYPVLNNVEPRPFNYLAGTLFTYIFNSSEECDKAIARINKEQFFPFGLQISDAELFICKINNALIIYVPSLSVKARMTINAESLVFYKEAKETRGLSTEMVNLLGNLGYTNEEILELPQEEINRIFAPGAHLDGGGFDISCLAEEEQKVLLELGISQEHALILNNLGYDYEDMVKITKKELDLIFPNTELIAKLEELGLNRKDVDVKRKNGLSYKEIIKYALSL